MSNETKQIFDSFSYSDILLKTDRSWLEQKSKEELIDLIIFLANQYNAAVSSSSQSMFEGLDALKFPEINFEKIKKFKRLPARPVSGPLTDSWKVILVSPEEQGPHLPLELTASIRVGMPGGDEPVDLTLDNHNGRQRGVSRLHAIIQASEVSLSLLDISSTNGTYVNDVLIEKNKPHRLEDGDKITFSRVVFQLRILESPLTRESKL